MEFACFFASVGVPVTVIEMADQIVPGIDTDIAKILRAELASKGITFVTDAKVANIGADTVAYTDNKGAEVSVPLTWC